MIRPGFSFFLCLFCVTFVFLVFCVLVFWDYCYFMLSLAVQLIAWKDRLQSEILCVERDIKHLLTDSLISMSEWKCSGHSLANCDSCSTPAKSEAIEYLQVGPTEIRYSIAWTIFVYL